VSRSAMRVCLWAFLGSMLLQSAWILALPPFRGLDEFDHAYRAAAVADGQWVSPGDVAPMGRGELVRVPAGIVTDAEPACAALPYTGRDNCHAVDELANGEVTVASAASRYNPVFYWVIGTAAEPFDGVAALYVMRVVGALLCSVLVTGAAWVTTRWARTWWPLVGIAAALTPVTMYTTAVAAPNGVEVAAALGLWMSLLGLNRVEQRQQPALIVAAALFSLPLAVVRGLGPVWLASALAIWLLLVGGRTAWATIRSHPKIVGICAAVVVTATSAASLWTVVVGSMELEDHGPFPNAVTETVNQIPLWFLQSLAAFPSRDEPAPAVVYVAGGLAVAALLGLGAWCSTGRTRVALLAAFGLALAIPLVLTLQSYEAAGAIWQGRYGWPLSMGVLLLCARALDDRPPRHRLIWPGLLCAGLAWATAHAASTVSVALKEADSGLFADDPRWWTVDPSLIGLMSALSIGAWALMVRAGTASPPPLADAAPDAARDADAADVNRTVEVS
jgi:hypothetical protein